MNEGIVEHEDFAEASEIQNEAAKNVLKKRGLSIIGGGRGGNSPYSPAVTIFGPESAKEREEPGLLSNH